MVRRVATFKLETDEKGAVTGLKKVQKSAGTTGEAFGRFGKAAKLAMGGVAAGSAIALATEMSKRGAQIESIMTRTETVFGDGAAAAKRWADDNNEAFGTSEAGLLDMANSIQDLLVPLGFARDEAQGMTTDALDVANALSEWTGGKKSVAEASEAIRKAMLNEREMLKEFGVALSDAEVKARLAALGLDELTGSALDQAKAQVSLELIMEKSADAITAYNAGGNQTLRDQKELAAQVADLKDEAALLATTLTAKVVPALSGVLGELTENARAAAAFRGALESGATAAEAMFAAAGESDDVAELQDLMQRTGLTMNDLTTAMEGGKDGVDGLLEGLAESGEAFDMSTVEAELLSKALVIQAEALEEVEAAQKLAEAAIRTTGEETRKAGDATYYHRDAVQDDTAAIKANTEELKAAADPLFNALQQVRDYEKAQRDLIAARNDETTTAGELREAEEKVALAYLDVKIAMERLDEEGKDKAISAFEEVAKAIGLSEEAVRRILGALTDWDNWQPKVHKLTVQPNEGFGAGGGPQQTPTPTTGPIRSGITVNVNGANDPVSTALAVKRELEKLQRRNGSVGFG